MRNIVTISLPSSVKQNIDNIIKQEKYASVSEFFRDAIRAYEEDKLIKEIEESQREFSMGKGKRLRSLKDLM